MNVILIILGLIIVVLTLIDFFHTTLAAQGYGFITERLHKYLSFIILRTKSNLVFTYSGALHIIINASLWLFLLLLGSFLIFLSDEQMVINSHNGEPANAIGRFYYTCYVVSTTGIGDFVPGTSLSRIVTSILTLSGFSMLTISVTYLLSVSNAVNDERVLGSYISTMGKNVDELYHYLETEGNFTIDSSGDLRTLILKHTSNHLSFPIVQRFLTPRRAYCSVLQLASLYEVLNVIRSKTDKTSQQWNKLESLLNALHFYLHLQKNEYYENTAEETRMKELRSHWGKSYGETLAKNDETDRLIHLSLKSVGRTWDDVYDLS